MFSFTHVLAFLALLWVVALGCHRYYNRPFPPSPPGHWFFGHTFHIPAYKPWAKFIEWGRSTAGPLYILWVARNPVIILNDFQVADDLFNKQRAAFSTRPPRVMASLCGFDRGLTFLPPGRSFKKTRRYLHEALNVRAIQACESMQMTEAQTYALRLLESSENVQDESRMLYSAMLISFSLGYRPPNLSDSIIAHSDRVAKDAALILTTGKFWVEFFPFVRHLPVAFLGSQVARCVRDFKADLEELITESSRITQAALDHPEIPASFCSKILREVKSQDYVETKELVDYASLSMYAGAVDTTIASVDTFLVAMMLNPDIQLKAQKELDNVLGSGRLPIHADRTSLPYVEAILTEVLRWNPPVPLTSRKLASDVDYSDYILPGGASVVANIWAMNHDPELFSDPQEFQPERFIGPTGREAIRLVHQATFGFGIRVCPGQHFATSSLWIVIATLLVTFTISTVPGEHNEPGLDCEEGALIRVLPYKCTLKPRSQAIVDALKRCSESSAAAQSK
ncbi:cytochrome P450 [Mycena metata]|uniref:Cytochrome P450 n=1 Tax=Mycena metata TaxID=1033252 RepID=A0AAD7J9Q6_9AGAR|nr:cytochrome P450 [Mycena metata]